MISSLKQLIYKPVLKAQVLAPWLYATIILLFITPNFSLPAVGGRRLDEFLMLGLIGFLVYLYAQRVPFKIAWGPLQYGLLGFNGVVLLSMLVGALQGYEVSTTDVFQFIRIAKYLVVYTFAVTVIATSENPDRMRRNVLHAVLWGSLLLFFIVLQQYYDLFGLNAYYVEYVSRSSQAASLINVDYDKRALGMIGNPNELGFLYVIPALVSAYFLLSAPRFKLRYLILFGIQVTAILMTLSRTSLLALVVALLYMLIVMPLARANEGKLRIRSLLRGFGLLFVVIAATSLLITNQAIYDDVLWRFAKLQDVTTDYSFRGRIQAWQENWGLFLQSPWFGLGPLFGRAFEFTADNEWLLFLRSYGLIGTLYLILSFAFPYVISIRAGSSPLLPDIRRLIEAAFIALVLYMIPAAAFQSLILMPLLLILLALGDRSVKAFEIRK